MFIPTSIKATSPFELSISGNVQNYDVHAQLEASEGTTITDPYNLNITMSNSVVVGSSSTGTYAMDFNSVPSGSVITVTMGDLSYIVGRGGQTNGQAGGPAVRVPAGVDVTFETAPSETATIGGGGGAGGQGYRIDVWQRTCSVGDAGDGFVSDIINHGGTTDNIGGGGAGNTAGVRASTTSGGSGATPQVNYSNPPDPNDPGNPGNCLGQPWYYWYTSVGPTSGGAGGALGAAGSTGYYAGGAAGLAIQGIAQVTTGVGVSVLGSTA